MITLATRLRPPGTVWSRLALCRERLAIWAWRARARAQLARLDDRDYRDIGVTPAEAAAEYRKPFWRA
jgi:uncharacterized protein YjiS (DUF1127 family)